MKRIIIAGLMALAVLAGLTGCKKEMSLLRLIDDALLSEIAQVIPTDDNGCIVVLSEKKEVKNEKGEVIGEIVNKRIAGKLNTTPEKAAELYKKLHSGTFIDNSTYYYFKWF